MNKKALNFSLKKQPKYAKKYPRAVGKIGIFWKSTKLHREGTVGPPQSPHLFEFIINP